MLTLTDLGQHAATLAVCMLRPMAMIAIFPALNRRLLGTAVAYNGMILVLTLPMLPRYLDAPVLVDSSAHFIGLLLGEWLIGLSLGFVAAIPFWAIQVSGELIDSVRGASISTSLNPLTETETSLMGNLFNQLVTVLFFSHGGFETVLDGFYSSYLSFRPGRGLGALSAMGDFVANQWAVLWELGITFALPALGAMILIDISLGMVNKSVKQLPVFFLSMPLKSLMGIVVIALGLAFSVDAYLQRMKTFEATAVTTEPFE